MENSWEKACFSRNRFLKENPTDWSSLQNYESIWVVYSGLFDYAVDWIVGWIWDEMHLKMFVLVFV